MKKTAKCVALFCAAMMVFALTGCQKKVGTAYEDKAVGFQLENPAVGEEIAVLHTSMGDIYLRFFPEAAPKAVENFKTLSKNGYYNNLLFHRVMKDFIIQGGDPKGDGTGGESMYTDNPRGTFADEFDEKLLNLRGALSMANGGANTNGSQFFINQAGVEKFGTRAEYSDETMNNVYKLAYEQYSEQYGTDFTGIYGSWEAFKEANYQETYIYDWIPDEVWDVYEKTGGNISLDGAWRKTGGHTVFGQVFRGMDVVDAIAVVAVNDKNKPETDVVIQSIDITPCTAEMLEASAK